MHPFATQFAARRPAPLTFDRIAISGGHAAEIADGLTPQFNQSALRVYDYTGPYPSNLFE